MSAAGMRARSDMRARPLSLVFVTILVGLIGAVAIAAFAGARRTDSAFARYHAETGEPETVILSCPKGSPTPPIDSSASPRSRRWRPRSSWGTARRTSRTWTGIP